MGVKQIDVAGQLGISQGHYSKVLAGRARPGRGLLARAAALTASAVGSDFESRLLEAVRSTPKFQQLLQLLLDMHLHTRDRRS